MITVSFLCKCQSHPGIYAQKNDQECLYRMDDEHEKKCVVRLDTVEYEHRLHGKMPWTCTIRGRNYHGYAPHYKRNETARQP